jgi:cell wall-associated NlpC family hydrolase
MSLSDAIGQVDQIVQWEQQLADPAALSQNASTGGVALTGGTPSTGATGAGSGTAFADALAQAQAQDGATATAASTLDPAASTTTGSLLSGGDSQLLTALSSLSGSGSAGLTASSAATGAATAGAATTGAAAAGTATTSAAAAGTATTGAATAGTPTTPTTSTATGPDDPRIQAMIQEASTLIGKPYVWGGGHDGWGPQSGYDCSGFVSAVLHAGGYLTTPEDTTTLPSAAGIESGPGRYVTIYDRDGPGQSGHVIIEIDGQFYESGGEHGSWGGGGGVAQISTPSAAYLATFDKVLHPAGL